MRKLTTEQRSAALRCLVEGSSIRSTCRMTGVSKKAVTKLLLDLGEVCADYQDRTFRGLALDNLQLDEIWSFVGCKSKNVPTAKLGEHAVGDVWVWTALDSKTKLIPCWHVGRRDANAAFTFIDDLSGRLLGTPQISTDGLKVYIQAIKKSFGPMVDYSQVIKIYGQPESGTEARYSPARIIGCETHRILGDPIVGGASTSHVERSNLSMRMGMRRFTRLTNGFSKRVQNHEAAVAVYFFHYNLCRIHKTLRVTPAMAAGVSDHVWEIEEVISLLNAAEAKKIVMGKMKRGPYRPKNSK